MKRCNKCGEEKPLSEFHKNKRKPDGHENFCRECNTARCKAYRASNPDAHRKSTRKYEVNNREKLRAYVAVAEALKAGILTRANKCDACGIEEALDAHHEDYAKRLDVVWLCRLCHKRRHA